MGRPRKDSIYNHVNWNLQNGDLKVGYDRWKKNNIIVFSFHVRHLDFDIWSGMQGIQNQSAVSSIRCFLNKCGWIDGKEDKLVTVEPSAYAYGNKQHCYITVCCLLSDELTNDSLRHHLAELTVLVARLTGKCTDEMTIDKLITQRNTKISPKKNNDDE